MLSRFLLALLLAVPLAVAAPVGGAAPADRPYCNVDILEVTAGGSPTVTVKFAISPNGPGATGDFINMVISDANGGYVYGDSEHVFFNGTFSFAPNMNLPAGRYYVTVYGLGYTNRQSNTATVTIDVP